MYKKNGLLVLFISIFLSVNAQSTLRERLKQHVFTLASDSLQGREAGTEFARMAADYVVAQFTEIGIELFFENSFLQQFGQNNAQNSHSFQNVIGIIRGNDADLANEFIVVGAHYDHLCALNGNIYNDADDNASGVAMLIELARMLKEYQRKLKRSVILVAFDAEEIGLLGSTYFVNSSIVPLENIF